MSPEMPSNLSIDHTQPPIIEIDKEMETYFQEAPSIPGVFSPQDELVKMWQMEGNERKTAFETFKRTYVKQMEALAMCRVFIEKMITHDPDAPNEQLDTILTQFAERYGFTDAQRNEALARLNDYAIIKKSVLDKRTTFPDDFDLVQDVTGIDLSGDDAEPFSVSIGPMSIDIITTRKNAKQMWDHDNEESFDERIKAFTVKSSLDVPIPYIVVVASNVNAKGDPLYDKQLLDHERQHVITHFFYDSLISREASLNARLYAATTRAEQKRELAEEYFRFVRKNSLQSVKNEVFSHEIQGVADYIEHFSANEIYDYLEQMRNEPIMQRDEQWQALVQRMLVDEYRTIIERGINAFRQLSNQGGYTTEQAIALLTDQPMEQWHSRVRMILEQKGDQRHPPLHLT
jgi:hypothetical protein